MKYRESQTYFPPNACSRTQQRQGAEGPLWARSRPWPTESERLLSPEETLEIVSCGAATGTQGTLATNLIESVISNYHVIEFLRIIILGNPWKRIDLSENLQ
jgi:hypothetical protein